MAAMIAGTNCTAGTQGPSHKASSDTTAENKTLRVVLIRHPYTIANAAGLLQGSTDSPLTQYGVQQMDHLCSRIPTDPFFASHLPPSLILTSPLGRCRRLADSLAAALAPGSLPAAITALQERDFGQLECTKKGVHAGSRFPQGSAGKKKESRDAFEARVKSGFKECLTAGWDAIAPSRSHSLIFVVTHGLWISTFARAFLPAASPVPFADNTGMFIVDATVSHGPDAPSLVNVQLIKANHHPHLTDMARKQRGLSNLPDDGKQSKLSSFFGKRKQRDDED